MRKRLGVPVVVSQNRTQKQQQLLPKLRFQLSLRIAGFPQISVAVDFQRHCQSADGARNHCDSGYGDLYCNIVRVRSHGALQANSENCVTIC